MLLPFMKSRWRLGVIGDGFYDIHVEKKLISKDKSKDENKKNVTDECYNDKMIIRFRGGSRGCG